MYEVPTSYETQKNKQAYWQLLLGVMESKQESTQCNGTSKRKHLDQPMGVGWGGAEIAFWSCVFEA